MAQLTLGGKAVHYPPHVLGMTDLQSTLHPILRTAIKLKRMAADGAVPKWLAQRSVLLIFEKNSTRTRVSFEIGLQRLGAVVVSLDAQNSQIARGESMEDTAKVLSRYADAIVYRANKHSDVAQLAEHASVPVVNALTDLEHPCQVLADLMTLVEKWGDLQGKTFAYVGDGNNMCHSYMLGAAMAGMHVRIATPAGYAPDPNIIEQAEVLARMQGVSIDICNDPQEAVQGADAVATDTWISMGDEADTKARLAAFEGFTVDEGMMQVAGPDALFLHCLPGHWGEEATYEVAHGPRSVIYDEAENRMWAQMALMTHLLGGPPA